MLRHRRCTAALAAAALVSATAGLLEPSAAAAAPARPTATAATSAAATTRAVRVASGVSLSRSSFTLDSGRRHLPEKMVTVSVTLSAHTVLVAEAAHGVIGAQLQTVLAMARRHPTIAAINGDFYGIGAASAVPRGGLMRNGHLLKSPRQGYDAALYATTGGVARIGDPGFHATVRTARASYAVYSVNTPGDATGHGRLTLVDHDLLTIRLPSGCAVATLVSGRHGHTAVGTVTRNARYLFRPAAGGRALVGCGAGRRWLEDHLSAGTTADVSIGYAVKHLRTVIGGGTVLIRSGRRFHDPTGHAIGGSPRNPATFACVSASGRQLLLGVVDGRSYASTGVTYDELTTLLLARHCWSALVFDGGGSSTVVAKLPGHALAVQNSPSDWTGPRPVADSLLVTS